MLLAGRVQDLKMFTLLDFFFIIIKGQQINLQNKSEKGDFITKSFVV